LLGRIIEVSIFFRELLQKDKNLVCVNPDNYGFVTLFRVYPKHIDAEKQYDRELNNPKYQDELRAYNLLQQRIANKLFAMLRDPQQKVPGWENPPYTSFTSGYRPPNYAPQETDSRNLIYALKSFPMSPNSNEISMQIVRNYVLKARDLVIEEILQECRPEINNAASEQTKVRKTGARTTDNWFGDNEDIPLKYLIPPKQTEGSIEEMIKNNPFCSHLSDGQIKQLLAASTSQNFETGKIICTEGEKADKVYLIVEGKVKIYKVDREGHETELAIIEKGNLFGEMALFDKGVRSASVITIEPCQFIIIEGNTFLELVLG
ncbi:MAG: cyclic nucleotide-binding domain-containing protein, partial [Candidatus Thermoplasmatota archaeon]|nr:cyclic nucleotide-binding domain-containing protein [Candidatus Thermoplasmatota archaeon]MBU1940472.1 cyclic nucleotide-binding domain-containing protein [Candidatus Thermoplasmatota archaeon]